jgi:hypothetical protein
MSPWRRRLGADAAKPEYDSDDDPDYTGMRAGYTNEQGEFVYFDDSDE